MLSVCRAVWGMLYTVDACIVSRSQRGFNKMMGDFVEVERAFALTMSAKKTGAVCPSLRVKSDDDADQSGRANVTNRCNHSRSPVLSTCPLHTNRDCGKEKRMLIGPR